MDKEIINWKELLYPYEQTVEELMLKFNYIKKEYLRLGLYSPIESVEGRVKSAASIIEKVSRKNIQREKIEEEMLDAEIVDVVLSGSRCRGLEKKGSDLDVVVEYKGSIREDDFFNMLHEDDYEISGIKVDINPITEVKTGKLETYLPGVKEYLRKKEMEKNERKSVREKIREKKDKARGETCKLKEKKRDAVR